MQVYLPVAEMPVDVLSILLLGTLAGFLSGMFGVGGGFLTTPLLIFIGLPPTVATASQANQLVGASISGVISQWRRGAVDFKMGAVLIAGGTVGSVLGVGLVSLLRRVGQIDFFISVIYVLVLGSVGTLMMIESVQAILRRRRRTAARRKLHQHHWMHGLPMKMRFPRSRLYISATVPLSIGVAAGLITAIMGVGGGFFLVPAMIYILGMPSAMVAGTSLFQIIFTSATVTFLQAVENRTVDLLLAVLMLIGGVIGAQYGARAAARLKNEHSRLLLAGLVLAVAVKLLVDLLLPPGERYSLGEPSLS